MAILDYENLKAKLGFLRTVIGAAGVNGLEDTIYGNPTPLTAQVVRVKDTADRGTPAQVQINGSTLLTCQLNWGTSPASTPNSGAIAIAGTPSQGAALLAAGINANTNTHGLIAQAFGAQVFILCVGPTTVSLTINGVITT